MVIVSKRYGGAIDIIEGFDSGVLPGFDRLKVLRVIGN